MYDAIIRTLAVTAACALGMTTVVFFTALTFISFRAFGIIGAPF